MSSAATSSSNLASSAAGSSGVGGVGGVGGGGGGPGGAHNKSVAIATGNALWNRVPKANAELFALTYGALVTEVLRDYGDDIGAVNEQLEKMGHSMGVRCVDEYLAKLSHAAPPCQHFLDTAEVLAKSALKMFLGITADVISMPAVPEESAVAASAHASDPSGSAGMGGGAAAGGGDATANAPYYSLVLADNPLAIFVELPDAYQTNGAGSQSQNSNQNNNDGTGTDGNGKPQLEYNSLYCGLIRGALEMLNMRVQCTCVKSTLRGDDVNEIKVQLKEVMAEGAGAEYGED